MKQRATMLCLLFVLTVFPACAGLMYSAEPMEAGVVDADTKQPLEGVIVVAHWELERGTPGGSVPAGQLMVMETVTDSQGKFSFPGFGPKPAVTSHLVHKDPELILFKSGYRYQILTNEYSGDIELRTRAVRRSEWNGKTIELKPFKGGAVEYANHLGSLNNNLYPLLGSDSCEWKKIPHMLLALTQQSRIFKKAGIEALYDVNVYLPVSENKCGSPKVFFETYRP